MLSAMTDQEQPDTAETPGRTILCAQCGELVRQAGVGRRRTYCSQTCRQRAYEERRVRAIVLAELAAAQREPGNG